MILNNYKKLFLNSTISLTNLNGTSFSPSNVTTILGAIAAKLSYSEYSYSYNNNCFMDIGFSDTAETAGDYTLDGNLDAGTLTKVSASSLVKNTGEIINMLLVVRNDTNANVTVREVGYLGNPTTSISSKAGFALFSRKVLETPVIIAPGETYSFNYIIKFKN